MVITFSLVIDFNYKEAVTLNGILQYVLQKLTIHFSDLLEDLIQNSIPWQVWHHKGNRRKTIIVE